MQTILNFAKFTNIIKFCENRKKWQKLQKIFKFAKHLCPSQSGLRHKDKPTGGTLK